MHTKKSTTNVQQSEHKKGSLEALKKVEKFTPNQTTIEAMLEAERIANDPSVKSFNDVNELFKFLDE